MKNFILFTYEFEYPRGGMRDFHGAYASLNQAKRAAAAWQGDNDEADWHVLHLPSRRVHWSDGTYTPLKSLTTIQCK